MEDSAVSLDNYFVWSRCCGWSGHVFSNHSRSITVELPAEGRYEIKIYWDAELANEVTFIDFGTVKFDTVYNITFYVKNLSNVSCKVGLYTPQATGLRWYQFRPWDFGKFESGEVKEITLIYQVDNSSEGGTFDFDVTFVVYPSE